VFVFTTIQNGWENFTSLKYGSSNLCDAKLWKPICLSLSLRADRNILKLKHLKLNAALKEKS
jgi:hypothetical protein